jgi:hypothetical protein
MININVADTSLEVELAPKNNGIRIWGNKDSFKLLYNRLNTCIGDDKLTHENEQTYIGVILSFLYDVRHVFAGDRLIRMNGMELLDWTENLFKLYKQDDERISVGLELSWPHIIYTLSALWECYRENDCPHELIRLTTALNDAVAELIKPISYGYYDLIEPYLRGAIYGADLYMMHAVCRIQYLFSKSRRNKRTTFLLLAGLLRCSLYGTKEYQDFHEELEAAAKGLHCSVADLSMDYDDE